MSGGQFVTSWLADDAADKNVITVDDTFVILLQPRARWKEEEAEIHVRYG